MPSDSEAVRRWLLDIQHHIQMAQGFVAGFSYDTFKDENLRIYAVTRCLEIISEASRRLPDELKNRNPSIEWRDMAAAGNIYRHEYEDVASRRVWHTLTASLPALLVVVEREITTVSDQVGWVRVKFELREDIEERVAKVALGAGMSIKCYCLRVLLKHLLEHASAEQRERWTQDIPAIFHRNG